MFFRRKKQAARDVAQSTPASDSYPEPSDSAKKILLVDDDAVTTTALSMKLKSKGYRVVTAQDGCQALTVTRTANPDLMLLDVQFPPNVGGVEWDGFLIAEWLQRRDGEKTLPVIVMSSADKPEYRQRASAAGAAAFFHKSVNPEELLASIDRALNGKGTEASGN